MAELLQREQQYTPLWQQSGRLLNFHRWAGFSGALAVILAAYGAHGHQMQGDKNTFNAANQMHFLHTLVLLAMPIARRPYVSGYLFLFGILLFSGGGYFRAFSGSSALFFISPIGGVILVMAWISMMF